MGIPGRRLSDPGLMGMKARCIPDSGKRRIDCALRGLASLPDTRVTDHLYSQHNPDLVASWFFDQQVAVVRRARLSISYLHSMPFIPFHRALNVCRLRHKTIPFASHHPIRTENIGLDLGFVSISISHGCTVIAVLHGCVYHLACYSPEIQS